jgi:hypothetical protein
MPRKARLEFPGAVYHLLDRGDHREPILREESDRDLSSWGPWSKLVRAAAGVCMRGS